MLKLALVEVIYGLIEYFQQSKALRCYACFHDPAIISLTFAGDPRASFHSIEKPSHVGIVRDHSISDAAAGKAFRLGATQDSKSVLRGSRRSRCCCCSTCCPRPSAALWSETNASASREADGLLGRELPLMRG